MNIKCLSEHPGQEPKRRLYKETNFFSLLNTHKLNSEHTALSGVTLDPDILKRTKRLDVVVSLNESSKRRVHKCYRPELWDILHGFSSSLEHRLQNLVRRAFLRYKVAVPA